MIKFNALDMFPLLGASKILSGVVIACLMLTYAAYGQEQSPLARVEALGLDSLTVGRVTALFEPDDRERAEQFAALSEEAATFFEHEIHESFTFRVAALGPENWFSEFPGIPYAIPWVSMSERLILMPASLQEGLLIEGRSPLADRRRVDFVLLHEFGHLLGKEYFRSTSDRDYLQVSWFEELLATYFAYSFIHVFDPQWAQAARKEWQIQVNGYTPSELSLDWSFMNDLPPNELAKTYGWYQFMLNLRVADIYDQHGLEFLRSLKGSLPWDGQDDWTTESLLTQLEQIAPGFQGWADELQGGAKQAIRNVLSESSNAWNRGDLDGYMKSFWKDERLRHFFNDDITIGYSAMKERFEARYPDPNNMGTISGSQFDIQIFGPVTAIASGRWSYTHEEVVLKGVVTLVFQKIDDTWLIVHDHSTALPQ